MFLRFLMQWVFRGERSSWSEQRRFPGRARVPGLHYIKLDQDTYLSGKFILAWLCLCTLILGVFINAYSVRPCVLLVVLWWTEILLLTVCFLAGLCELEKVWPPCLGKGNAGICTCYFPSWWHNRWPFQKARGAWLQPRRCLGYSCNFSFLCHVQLPCSFCQSCSQQRILFDGQNQWCQRHQEWTCCSQSIKAWTERPVFTFPEHCIIRHQLGSNFFKCLVSG